MPDPHIGPATHETRLPAAQKPHVAWEAQMGSFGFYPRGCPGQILGRSGWQQTQNPAPSPRCTVWWTSAKLTRHCWSTSLACGLHLRTPWSLNEMGPVVANSHKSRGGPTKRHVTTFYICLLGTSASTSGIDFKEQVGRKWVLQINFNLGKLLALRRIPEANMLLRIAIVIFSRSANPMRKQKSGFSRGFRDRTAIRRSIKVNDIWNMSCLQTGQTI